MTEARLKVAIVHYWFVGMGGGEKVVQALLELFPDADVFTLVYDTEFSQKIVGKNKLHASFLQKIPFASKMHRKLLPLMPAALENLDLSGYNLIVSSESGPSKGILPGIDALHICYCHSPMRYIWDQYHEYRRHTGFWSKLFMTAFITRLRLWDAVTSSRVDHFIANSHHIARRIRRYYNRDSAVIYPPVDVDSFTPTEGNKDFYLITGRHVSYKRIDLAIAACESLGRSLVVTGAGPDTERLKKLAGAQTRFVGQVPFSELKNYYAGCRAFLMPGEEDFGIAPVEAMASGRPVIALAKGGALDTVREDVSGILFDEQSVEGLTEAISRFEAKELLFKPQTIRAHAEMFSHQRFLKEVSQFVDAKLAGQQVGPAHD
jgi:glycosyltransferase involved in cell wall biosynthesis